MKTVLLITLSGKDRPGIVTEIARFVTQFEGNWEQSRMVHLSDRFVGLLQVTVSDERRPALEEALLSIRDLDFTIAEGEGDSSKALHSFQLEILGADHPGIVQEVFGPISEFQLNVESLITSTEAAADSGTILFRTNAILTANGPTDLDALRRVLERSATDLQVDLTLEEQ